MDNLFRRVARRTLVALAAAGLAGPMIALAQPVTAKDAWVRAPVAGQQVAGAYVELVSRTNAALLSVATPVAARVELHEMAVEDGVMKMRPVGRIELPAGKAVKLAPGGLHIMLMELKQPLKPGDRVPLTLTVQRADFSSRSVFTVEAEVRDAVRGKATPHHGGSH